MRLGIRKLCGLKVRRYADQLVYLNEYLDVFPGAKISEIFCVTDIYKISLNSTPNSWSKKAYVQGFDYEYITLKADVNLFECMEIEEYIYGGVVEPYHKKPTRADAKRDGHIRKIRGEAASSNSYSETSESTGKHRNRYLDHPMDRSKPICIMHGQGH